MKAALYARVSSEKQAEKDLSIPAQLKALRDFAIKKGWDIYDEFVDEAESARSADRPKFQEMVSVAKQKNSPFQVILVWKFSRFARNRQDSILYKALLRKHGVNVVSINEQIDDSPSGHFMEAILEAVDEFYSINLAHDTIRGMRENAARGFLNGGNSPFGYKRVTVMVGSNEKMKLAIEPSEAPIIKKIFELCLEGMGTKEITNTLNEQGHKTRAGKHWDKSVVHYVLTNETYTGTLIFNRYKKNEQPHTKNSVEKLIRADNAHPAIVDCSTFNKAQEFLKGRSFPVTHPRTIASEYLLTGFAYCGVCGAKMLGSSAKSGKFFYYACQNYLKKGKSVCNSKMVSQKRLEEAVIAKIKERVLTEDNIAKLVGLVNEEILEAQGEWKEKVEINQAQIENLQQKLSRLYAALETGKLDFDDLAPRIKVLRAQIEEIKRQNAEMTRGAEKETIQANDSEVREYVADLRDTLSNSSLVESKAFLRSWVKRIDLNKPQGGTIEYALPLVPMGGDGASHLEVLSMVGRSSPSWTIERTFSVQFNWA